MGSIKKELLSGVFYTAIAKYSGILISLIITGVLARLISPDKFGIVAVVTVITFFFSIFSDLGIGAAIIQNKELQQKDLNQLFSFTVWSGCILTLLFFLCSWPISFFYKEPSMKAITQLLAINLFFASANIVPNALLYKALYFNYKSHSFQYPIIYHILSKISSNTGNDLGHPFYPENIQILGLSVHVQYHQLF